MEKEIRVTTVIFILAGVFAAGTLVLNLIHKNIPIASPLADSFSVLINPPVKENPQYIVYGFLPYWSLQNIQHLQLDKLTDIAYFALNINADGTIKNTDPEGYADPALRNWENNEDLSNLIQESKTYGVNFALTIISHEDEVTYKFLDCKKCWDTLLRETTRELDAKNIKDINIDFELVEDALEGYDLKYSEFTAFMNTKLDERYGESKVVVSAHADSVTKPRITDIESLARVADYIFVMAYDFHRPTSDNSGPVAPIGGAGTLSEYDIATMLSDFLKYAPSNKLILGVPYYGYNWLVAGEDGYSERIPGTDELGYSISQTYADVTETRLKYNPQLMWDQVGLTPFFTYFNPDYGTTRQVYYDNADSLSVKYDLVKAKGLAGTGIWALGYDGGYQELWELLANKFFNNR